MKRLILVAVAATLIAGDTAKEDANTKDVKKMQGDWAAASIIREGTALPEDYAQTLFRTVKDDAYTVYRFNKAIGKGTFKIDASTKPKSIDAFPDRADKSKPLRGIYEFAGDNRVKVCFAPPGKERPTDFTAKEGSEHTCTTWEREKK